MSPQPVRATLPRLSQLEALNDAIVRTQEFLPRLVEWLEASSDPITKKNALPMARELVQLWEEAR